MNKGILWVFLALILAACGCSKKETKVADPLNRVVPSATLRPQNILHKTFKVNSYAKFEFAVPAHAFNPKLQGNFKAMTPSSEGSDHDMGAATVDFMVMTPEEFDDFAHGKSDEVTYSISAVQDQTVDYAMPGTLDMPGQYYLVFRNPSGKTRPESVKADLMLNF